MNGLSDFYFVGLPKCFLCGVLAVVTSTAFSASAQSNDVLVADFASASNTISDSSVRADDIGKASADPALTQELISVRALMRMEMALALDRARQQSKRLNEKTNMLASGASRLELPASELRLTALYGTGQKLVAEVQAGTRTLTYINGKPWPVGVTSGQTAYRLISIKGRCLTLVRQDRSQRVCLDAGPGGKP
ncbi:MAG: hypothetical protein CML17_12980 [Pusillimonas sp.]|jgi:hypothetical protein|nr:hypothetical protein [Pusillimonas sp.]